MNAYKCIILYDVLYYGKNVMMNIPQSLWKYYFLVDKIIIDTLEVLILTLTHTRARDRFY